MFGGPLSPSSGGTAGMLPHTVEQHDTVVTSYKQLIKEQDAELANFRHEIQRLQAELEAAKRQSGLETAKWQAGLEAANREARNSSGQSWQLQQSSNPINYSAAAAVGATADATESQLQQQRNLLAEKDRQIETLKAKLVILVNKNID